MSDHWYVLATSRPWNLTHFAAARNKLLGNWLTVTTPADLLALLGRVEPRYVFFPHWSHIVPAAVVEQVECVCFHMTDLPYGRGGSPLQNLIVRGHRETKLTALRMTNLLDGGPIYAKRPLSLAGSAEEIFERAGGLITEMIAWIVANEPAPSPQEGEHMAFERRTPSQSRIEGLGSAAALYDHIRMLDAPGYPKAFIDQKGWRMEFEDARLDGDAVNARVRFTRSAESI